MDVGSRGKRQGPPTTVGGKGRWAAPKSLGASWGEQSHCQETLAHWRGQQALGPTWEDTAGIRTDQLLVPSLFPQRAPPSGPSRPCPDCRILISNEWVSVFSPHPCQCLVLSAFLMLATLIAVSWYLSILVLHFTDDQWCGTSFHMYIFLNEGSVKVFDQFFLIRFFVFSLSFKNSFCILSSSPSLDVSFVNIFSQSVTLFHSCNSIFNRKKKKKK